MALLKLFFLLLLLLQLTQSLTLRVDNVAKNESSREPAYRVSRPEIMQPIKRVPQHLQDIRPGFVDDDAGDVIRIIEPPQHFQQLKRLRQRQPQQSAADAALVWEQPRKLSTNRGASQTPQHRPKINFTPVNADLLTQETQNNLQFPMEILASVRKTERLLQRQRKKQPLARQRHIQRQTHTLIAQKSLEQQLYQRGQQHRLRAAYDQAHKRSKRVKREINRTSNYNVAQGLKLVAHIGELLENATRFLPDELETKETTTTRTTIGTTTTTSKPNATNCDNNRRSRQRLSKQQGARKTIERRGRNFRHEATTAKTTITTTTKRQTKSTNSTATLITSATPLASRLVNSRKSTNNRNHLQQLAPSRRVDSVLYADIMSNIRNSWQEHDAQPFVAPQPQQQQQHNNNSDYRELDVYLKELDAIAKKLPSVSPITSIKGKWDLVPTATPNWYLINNEGMIYETQLDSKTMPKSTLFHLFPDMPQTNNPISTLDLE